MSEKREIPLFPLHPVLFPGGKLPLQIFEPRYMDMVARCMRDDSAFGVVLIRKGTDARLTSDAPQPEIFDVGTEARITDFNQLSNGRLGIVVRGGRKFRIRSVREQDDHLLVGRVEFLPEEPATTVGEEHRELVDILRELVKHPMIEKLGLEIELDDARSVGWRLAELLPIEPEIKQSLLKLQWPRERLQELTRLVNKLRG
ncbi:MAG TPA: LON peptidase substrate-binding domain-containing protein [Pseudomonadales bacterium]|jgi:Lon protease-like protein